MLRALPEWPLFGFADDIRPALAAAMAADQTVALATIVALGGGGPRPVGTQMLLGPGGASGFLSGGCLEADVAAHAAGVLESGEPARLVYGEGSPWPDIRLMCGARVEILVEAVAPGDPAARALIALMASRQAALWLSDGRSRRCGPLSESPPSWPGAFSRRYLPATRLLVAGGDPTALAIASLGAQVGLQTSLLRPLGPADPPPLAGVTYRREPIVEALAAAQLDLWTAVAVATHDAELDRQALLVALPSDAFYVGALGARRRAPERRDALMAAGLAPAQIERLVTPMGVDLGGKAPWDVAIAVLAQITAAREALTAAAQSSLGGQPL